MQVNLYCLMIIILYFILLMCSLIFIELNDIFYFIWHLLRKIKYCSFVLFLFPDLFPTKIIVQHGTIFYPIARFSLSIWLIFLNRLINISYKRIVGYSYQFKQNIYFVGTNAYFCLWIAKQLAVIGLI